MKLKLTACIDAPKEKIWKILSDISSIPLWVEPINSAYCEGDKEKGVGAIRVCHLKGNIVVVKFFWPQFCIHSSTFLQLHSGLSHRYVDGA